MSNTMMASEIATIPSVLRKLSMDNIWSGDTEVQNAAKSHCVNLVREWNAAKYRTIYTVGWGSSAWICRWFGSEVTRLSGVPHMHINPDTVPPNGNLENVLVVAISASGQSPDVCATVAALRNCGATVIGIIGAKDSTLDDVCTWIMRAPIIIEGAVPATAATIASMMRAMQLIGILCYNDNIMPSHLYSINYAAHNELYESDRFDLAAFLKTANKVVVIGNGSWRAIAGEFALKLQECCLIPALSYSWNEFVHGPLAFADTNTHFVLLHWNDDMIDRLEGIGSKIYTVFWYGGADVVPIVTLCGLYKAVEQLARLRDINPDYPPYITRITRTG